MNEKVIIVLISICFVFAVIAVIMAAFCFFNTKSVTNNIAGDETNYSYDGVYLDPGGDVGINTTTPKSRLDVHDVGNAQLRLTYDTQGYTEFTTQPSGDLLIAPANARAVEVETQLKIGDLELTDGVVTDATGLSIVAPTVVTGDLTLADQTDSTKRAALDISGITTGTTRTFAFPDQNGTFAMTSDLGGSTFSDVVFEVYNDGDATTAAKFECSGITGGATRTFTFPDTDGTFAMTSDLGGSTFSDADFEIYKDTDNSKKLVWDLSTVPSSTTRTLKPGAEGIVVVIDSSNNTTLWGTTILSGLGGLIQIDSNNLVGGDRYTIECDASRYLSFLANDTVTGMAGFKFTGDGVFRVEDASNVLGFEWDVSTNDLTVGGDLINGSTTYGDGSITDTGGLLINTTNDCINIASGAPADAIKILADGTTTIPGFSIGAIVVGDTTYDDGEIYGTTYGIFTMSDVLTDSTNKNLRFGVPSYDSDEQPFIGVMMEGWVSDNVLYLGGGTSVGNCATEISFWTTPTINTVTGTQMASIDSDGLKMDNTPIFFSNKSPADTNDLWFTNTPNSNTLAGGLCLQGIDSQTDGVPFWRVISTGGATRWGVQHNGTCYTYNYSISLGYDDDPAGFLNADTSVLFGTDRYITQDYSANCFNVSGIIRPVIGCGLGHFCVINKYGTHRNGSANTDYHVLSDTFLAYNSGYTYTNDTILWNSSNGYITGLVAGATYAFQVNVNIYAGNINNYTRWRLMNFGWGTGYTSYFVQARDNDPVCLSLVGQTTANSTSAYFYINCLDSAYGPYSTSYASTNITVYIRRVK